jgi:hypothetical protein
VIARVTATRFDRQASVGKTKPCFVTCERTDGSEVELVLKLSAGCDMRDDSLISEAVAALLARDLDLPAPEPFLVQVERDFVSTVPDRDIRSRMEASLGWNFGSKQLSAGFMTYPRGKPIPLDLIGLAVEILAFDTFIANVDRTETNPNLLFNGHEFAIYDHELAFLQDGILGWKPPWQARAVTFPMSSAPSNRHVFLNQLRGKTIDLSRLAGAFELISPKRLHGYRQSIPAEWVGNATHIDRVLKYIAKLAENKDAAIRELTGALR